MKTVCMEKMCTGCKACLNVCHKNAIDICDELLHFNAVIDLNKCINCGKCKQVCPQCNNILLQKPIYYAQGWINDTRRLESSSGGAALAIMISFIKDGGFVCSCEFKNGDFIFSITNNESEARKYVGSKYVKSNPDRIYSEVLQLLKEGNKVLFIGLPCQSAAIQNICKQYKEGLYTVDLVCHGTPSPQLLKQYIDEHKIEWKKIENISFRSKDQFSIYSNRIKILPNRVKDCYSIAFLNCLDYTENCYSCQYATFNRVSDITLGDAWGQLADTVKDGVSLVLCQTEKGKDLIDKANLTLIDVDIEKIIAANHQLQFPSIKHPGRKVFFENILKGKTFRKAVFKAMPKEFVKQEIKYRLIKIHLIKDFSRGGYGITVAFNESDCKNGKFYSS